MIVMASMNKYVAQKIASDARSMIGSGSPQQLEQSVCHPG
jgi:hypothetical protein